MRSARRSRASLAKFSDLSRSKQNASDRQRRANEAQAVERPAEHESNKETFKMKDKVTLTITSLLSILFFTFHLADDIVRGMEPGKLTNLTAVPIFVVWLYGTLVLAERRSGYVVMLLGGLFSLVVPIAHMRGKGVGVTSSLANSSGVFFFVWTLIAIGVTGLFSAILAARGLWSLRRGQSR
jgi:hypothetical protein